MIDPEYKESPEYLRECIAQLQADRDALLAALKAAKGWTTNPDVLFGTLAYKECVDGLSLEGVNTMHLFRQQW